MRIILNTNKMQLTAGKYAAILSVQTVLILIDCVINVASVLTRQHNAVLLILFIVQDACLILALSILLLTFFSTYVFQTGLVYLLYERFRCTLVICVLYFFLTTLVNVWCLVNKWNTTLHHTWTTTFIIAFIIQRLMATIYYYFYKRAALRISDPRFYEDIEWEQKHNGSVH